MSGTRLHWCCGTPVGGDHEPYCDVGVYQAPAVDLLFYDQRVAERDEARANLQRCEQDLITFAKIIRSLRRKLDDAGLTEVEE